MNFEVIRTK